MLRISAEVIPDLNECTHEGHSISLGTRKILDKSKNEVSSLTLKHMEYAFVAVKPCAACGGLLSTISLKLKYQSMGLMFQEVRFIGIDYDEYPSMVPCFVTNLSLNDLLITTDGSYFYQWFQTAQYL